MALPGKSWKSIGPLGGGLGSYEKYFHQYRDERSAVKVASPDNLYLRIVAETGVLGLVLFLTFLYSWVRTSVNLTKKESRDSRIMRKGILVSVGAFFLTSLLFDSLFWSAMIVPLSILMGLASTPWILRTSPEKWLPEPTFSDSLERFLRGWVESDLFGLGQVLKYWYTWKLKWARFKIQFIPRRHWRILDVGSGDGPNPSADVLCDLFIGDDTERTGPLRMDRPFLVGDVEDLPLVSGAFDFVYCSHLLEHTRNPQKAILELQRVANSGYIEVPSEILEKTAKSTAAHLWFVKNEKGTLVFTPKPEGVLDPSINDIFDNSLLNKDPLYTAFHLARFYKYFNIGMQWNERIHCRMEGKDPRDTMGQFNKGKEDSSDADVFAQLEDTILNAQKMRYQEKGFISKIKRVIKRFVRAYYAAGKSIHIFDILACPFCKNHLKLIEGEKKLICIYCLKSYRIVQGVPFLLRSKAQKIKKPTQVF